MTRIRVEPNKLRQTAQRLEAIADRLRSLGREALGITLNAPSYEGQFGPKARTMGLEAEARLVTQADRTSALCEELIAKAEAFEAADQRSLAALNQLGESMGEWMEQAAPILASLAMASAFPWQLVQRHLRLGSLIDTNGPSLGPLGPPPIGPDPPEGIPLRVWYHLPRDDQLAILMEIAAEGKSAPTAWIPLVRPPFINAEAWGRIPIDDQRAILLEIGEWPAIFGVTVGSTRYVRANLDALNRVWTYDEDGNIVETDMSYFDVDALSGEIWVEYDFEEVTRSISEEELLNESEQSVAVRLIISEVGADRINDNQNGIWEGIGILWTVENRETYLGMNPEELIRLGLRPDQRPTWGDRIPEFINIVTAPGQYLGIYTDRALSPLSEYSYLSPGSLQQSVDIAAVAHELQSSRATGDITHGAIDLEKPGAIEYRHRCGPPGHEAYGDYTTRCDDPEEIKRGADPYKGPLVFLGLDSFNKEVGGYNVKETGAIIDYVPQD
jgi:hypothetical protein